MPLRPLSAAAVALCLATGAARLADAAPITASVDTIAEGFPLALSMTVDDTTTRLVVSGPSSSWFAWGFGATTMAGYTVIVEGLDANRTVVEQNMFGIGQEGSPQAAQNLQVVSIDNNATLGVTTIALERANSTGDPNDPVFSTSLTTLPVIWGFSQFSSPDNPAPTLSFHGIGGRGFATLNFTVVPEPGAVLLATIAWFAASGQRRR